MIESSENLSKWWLWSDSLFDADLYTVTTNSRETTQAQNIVALKRLLIEASSFVQSERNLSDERATTA